MPAGRRLLAAICAGLACGGVFAAPLDILDACIAGEAPQSRGIAALEAACPGLESALVELGQAQVLPEGWREQLGHEQLPDLASLARRYSAQQPADALAMPALHDVLDQLASEQKPLSRGWWDTFTTWLRSWISGQKASSGWFDRLLERIEGSAGLIRIVAYALVALVVIAIVLFVINELKIAGVLSRRRQQQPGPDGTGPHAAGDSPGEVDLDSLSPLERPAALLRLLVARLLANGQLRADRSLTHRELAQRSQFEDAEGRSRFERLAQLAERLLYGGGDARDTHSDAVVEDGRALLAQLQRPAADHK